MTPEQIAQQISTVFVEVHPLLRVHANVKHTEVEVTVTHLDSEGLIIKASSQVLKGLPAKVDSTSLQTLLVASRDCLRARLAAPRSSKPFAIEPHDDLLPSETILTSLLNHPSPAALLSEQHFWVTLSRHFVEPWLADDSPRNDQEWKYAFALTFEGRINLGLDPALEAIAKLAPLGHLQGFCRRMLDDWIAEEARLVQLFGPHAPTDELRLIKMAARSFRETWGEAERHRAAQRCEGLSRFRGSWIPSPPTLPKEVDPEPPLPDFLQRLVGWLKAHRPEYLAAMKPGASAEHLDALEAELGFALHPDLRAWWGFRDGANTFHAFHRDGQLTSTHYARQSNTSALACERTNLEPDRWVQLTVGCDLNDVLFVDHAGLFEGTAGQIVRVDSYARSLTVEAPSLSAWITGLLAMYETTSWVLERECWFQDVHELGSIDLARTTYNAAVPGYPKDHVIEVREPERPKRKPQPLPGGTAELHAQVRELLAAKQKIKAIKIWRDATGDGLKEAKAAVEAIGSQ